MEAWLGQPVVQSGLAPLAASLLVGVLLSRRDGRWQGLAVVAGFAAAALLIVGPTLLPLTSTRKILLAALGLPLLALVLDLRGLHWRWSASLLAGGTLAALVWVLWPVLARQDVLGAMRQAAVPGLYVVVQVLLFAVLARGCARLAGASLGLALATGAACVIGASALYGQLAFALAAALAGPVLLRLWRPGGTERRCLGLASAMAMAAPLALLGASATVYARLPWTVLPVLSLLALPALWPLAAGLPAWLRALLALLLSLPPALVAVYLAWRAAGDIVY